jgi:hypothetical protein
MFMCFVFKIGVTTEMCVAHITFSGSIYPLTDIVGVIIIIIIIIIITISQLLFAILELR